MFLDSAGEQPCKSHGEGHLVRVSRFQRPVRAYNSGRRNRGRDKTNCSPWGTNCVVARLKLTTGGFGTASSTRLSEQHNVFSPSFLLLLLFLTTHREGQKTDKNTERERKYSILGWKNEAKTLWPFFCKDEVSSSSSIRASLAAAARFTAAPTSAPPEQYIFGQREGELCRNCCGIGQEREGDFQTGCLLYTHEQLSCGSSWCLLCPRMTPSPSAN